MLPLPLVKSFITGTFILGHHHLYIHNRRLRPLWSHDHLPHAKTFEGRNLEIPSSAVKQVSVLIWIENNTEGKS